MGVCLFAGDPLNWRCPLWFSFKAANTGEGYPPKNDVPSTVWTEVPRSCGTATADTSKIFMAKFVRAGSLLSAGAQPAGTMAVGGGGVLCVSVDLLFYLFVGDLFPNS